MEERFIFNFNDKYPSCHASVICELPNGDLLASWFAGSVEAAGDTVHLGSRLTKGSNKWSDPFILVNVAHHASGNPRLFIGPDKAVWLLAPINYGHWCQDGTMLFLKRSYDNGYTWTDLELFVEKKGVLGKNKPIQLQADPSVWIIPAEYERTWVVTFILSENSGGSWDIVGEIGRNENIRLHQPTLVELHNGDLLAYMRSWEGHIYQTRSSDRGETWAPAVPTTLLNNNSGIDMVKLQSSTLVLVFNPIGLGKSGKIVVDQDLKRTQADEYNVKNLCLADDKNSYHVIGREKITDEAISDLYPQWGPRTPLSIAVSKNDGQLWTIVKDLETEEGEFSYPAIIQGKERRIHITYTYNRKHIKHVALEENELIL